MLGSRGEGGGLSEVGFLGGCWRRSWIDCVLVSVGQGVWKRKKNGVGGGGRLLICLY